MSTFRKLVAEMRAAQKEAMEGFSVIDPKRKELVARIKKLEALVDEHIAMYEHNHQLYNPKQLRIDEPHANS